jgi:putative nucleotidyltransferase with HDIG domain
LKTTLNKPTVEEAKGYCNLCLNKIQDKQEAEFLKLHSRKVAEIAKILGEKKKLDTEILEIAGYLHDIGRSIVSEGHAKKSIELAEKEFKLSESLKDCILNHGSKSEPVTKEGKIFQIADKLAIIDIDVFQHLMVGNMKNNKKYLSKAIAKCEKGIEKL